MVCCSQAASDVVIDLRSFATLNFVNFRDATIVTINNVLPLLWFFQPGTFIDAFGEFLGYPLHDAMFNTERGDSYVAEMLAHCAQQVASHEQISIIPNSR